MTNRNTKASDSTLTDKQYKLCDFIPEFTKFRSNDLDFSNKYGKIDDNLYQSFKREKIYFKSINVRCNKCNHNKVRMNAAVERKLIFLNIGVQNCLVQQFQCKKCNATIPTDLSSIVRPNSNITYPVIKHIIHLYSLFTGSLHKIQKSLKIEHNIEISHQSIENIMLFSNFELEFNNWSLSGYYIFDALWVRKDGEWWYLICLFDVKINTIVARSLVKSESTETIYAFLSKTLSNQKKKYITTDLKPEYRLAINKININHQFCLFHTKQKIYRDINDYIGENNPSEEELKIINHYKNLIYELIDANELEISKSIKNELIDKNGELLEIIHEILWEFIVPYFKHLTWHLDDNNVESTSNKLENCFLKNFNKATKKMYKSENGILKRFDLKLNNWNDDNANL